MLCDNPAAVVLQRAWTCPVSTSLRHPWRVSGARLQPLWGSWMSPSSSGGKNQHAEAEFDGREWKWTSFLSSSSKNIVYSCRAVINSAATLSITAKMSFVKGAQIWSRPLTVALYDAGLCDHLCCHSERCCVLRCVCLLSVKPSRPVLAVLGSTASSVNVTWRSTGDAGCRLRHRANGTHAWTLVGSPTRSCLSWISVCLTLGLGGESDWWGWEDCSYIWNHLPALFPGCWYSSCRWRPDPELQHHRPAALHRVRGCRGLQSRVQHLERLEHRGRCQDTR